MEEELKYRIALTLIPQVGDVLAKNLLAYCGSAGSVFKERQGLLVKIPGIGDSTAKAILKNKSVLERAEEEVEFVKKYKIQPLFYTDEHYPQRLKYCNDSPILLYYKGNADLNNTKVVSVVGTRAPNDYGRELTAKLIQELAGTGVLIVSGLAYGIDVQAHREALDNKLETIGVVAHGLDMVYPGTHTATAKKMIKHGGLLTDFPSGTNPDAVNFPKRNRIVAGLCDALVVVQSKREGGSLITATIASSYNKDVFAFPGRPHDHLSEGCNGLIKRNKASLIESAADLIDAMNWGFDSLNPQHVKKKKQIPLNIALSDEEQKIAALFKEKKEMHIDELCYAGEITLSNASALLLQLELNNLVKSKPGKVYEFLG